VNNSCQIYVRMAGASRARSVRPGERLYGVRKLRPSCARDALGLNDQYAREGSIGLEPRLRVWAFFVISRARALENNNAVPDLDDYLAKVDFITMQ
jgi:hypothetical protein